MIRNYTQLRLGNTRYNLFRQNNVSKDFRMLLHSSIDITFRQNNLQNIEKTNQCNIN